MENDKSFSSKLNEYFKGRIKLSFVSDLSTIVITEEDIVYEFKKEINDFNRNTVIGLTNNKSIIESSIKKSINIELCEKGLIDFKNSKFHTIARTTDGKLYSWGKRYGGLLGNGLNDDEISKPELNKYLSDKVIVDICCGQWHSLVLTNDGDVYAWGVNDFGQIGNSKDGKLERQLIPYKVEGFNGELVKAISCGSKHSLVLTNEGHAFSWGHNKFGQLGLGIKDESCNIPKLIEMNGIVIEKISCGSEHSLMLSKDGDIYVFGSNEFSQLGIDFENLKQYTPKKLKFHNKFIEITSHPLYRASIALSREGYYYAWGGCGDDVINEPKNTNLRSFDEVFENYFQISYKSITGRIILFDDTFIRNGFNEIKFFVLEKLGEGSFGEVFKVRNEWDVELYALKKIRFRIDSELEFLNELKISSAILKLHHESVVEYRDKWLERSLMRNDDLTFYIQMDLCDSNLRYLIREMESDLHLCSGDRLTLFGYYVASELCIRMLEGVNYLHQRIPQIIHRDLKPDNIMLKINTEGKALVKIGDFGLAALHKYVHQLHEPDVGNIKYAAPEVLKGMKYDTKADIYSLGIILEELFVLYPRRDYYMNDEIETSILMSKYTYISDFQSSMCLSRTRIRPGCEKILDRKHLWTLNKSEFRATEEFSNFEKSNEDKSSFIYKYINALFNN